MWKGYKSYSRDGDWCPTSIQHAILCVIILGACRIKEFVMI